MSPKHDSKPAKEANKKIRRDAYKKLGLIFLGILLLVNTVQLASFGGIVERVDSFNKGLIDELGGVRQDVVTFATDLNEIREFLLLPTKEYSFNTEEKEEESSQEGQTTSRTEQAIFGFLGSISEEQNYEKNAKLAEETVHTLAEDEGFIQSLKDSNFTLADIENNDIASLFKIKDANANPLFAFAIEKKTNEAKIQSAMGAYAVKAKDIEPLKTEIVQYCKEHAQEVAELKKIIEEQKASILELPKNDSVASVFNEKKISLGTTPEETDEAIIYPILNSENEKLVTIELKRQDGSLHFQDKSYKTFEEFLPEFVQNLQTLDASTAQEKLTNSRKQELEGIFNDAAFQELLKSNELTVSTTPREDYNQLLYDVKKANGDTAFSFVIELSSGYYKVLKDGEEIDLLSTLDAGSKKKL